MLYQLSYPAISVTLEKVAELMGLEPTTFGVTGRRSKPIELQLHFSVLVVIGGRNRVRTYDSLRVRQVLSH